METRIAKLADAPVLADLHGESFGAARWSLSQISESLKLKTTAAFVAEDGVAVRGFILCQITPDSEAEILTLCTQPSARRGGVGMLLLHAAIEAARAKRAQRMFLEVAVDNAPALALYQKAGFDIVGKRPRYYARENGPVDAIMLSLDLQAL